VIVGRLRELLLKLLLVVEMLALVGG